MFFIQINRFDGIQTCFLTEDRTISNDLSIVFVTEETFSKQWIDSLLMKDKNQHSRSFCFHILLVFHCEDGFEFDFFEIDHLSSIEILLFNSNSFD